MTRKEKTEYQDADIEEVKMAYTPKLSLRGSATLRRLAWLGKKPMTVTLEEMVEIVSMELNKIKPGAVCGACRDKSRCSRCVFNNNLNRRP